MHIIQRKEKESKKREEGYEEAPKFKALGVHCQVLNRLLGTPDLWYCIERFGLQPRSFCRLREVKI